MDEGSKSIQDQKKSLDDYRKAWAPIVNEIKNNEQAGRKLTETDKQILKDWEEFIKIEEEFSTINADSIDGINSLNDELDQHSQALLQIENRYAAASEALAKFAEASKTSVGDNLEGAQSAYKQFIEDFEAGKYGSATVKAYVDMVVPPEVQAALGYDMQKIAQVAAGQTVDGINSEYAKLIASDSPLQSFQTLLQQVADNEGKVYTESGNLAAQIDENGQMHFESWSSLAEFLGTTIEGAQFLISGFQEYTGQTIYSTEELRSKIQELSDAGESLTADNLVDVAAAVAATSDSADPAKVADLVKQLYDFQGIELDEKQIEVIANTVQASLQGKEAAEAFNEGVEGQPDPKIPVKGEAETGSGTAAGNEIKEEAEAVKPEVTISGKTDDGFTSIRADYIELKDKTVNVGITGSEETENLAANLEIIKGESGNPISVQIDSIGTGYQQVETILDASKNPIGIEFTDNETGRTVYLEIQDILDAAAAGANIDITANTEEAEQKIDALQKKVKKANLWNKLFGTDFGSKFAKETNITEMVSDWIDGIEVFTEKVSGATFSSAFDDISNSIEKFGINSEQAQTKMANFQTNFGHYVDEINYWKDDLGEDLTPEMDAFLKIWAEFEKIKPVKPEVVPPSAEEFEESLAGIEETLNENPIQAPTKAEAPDNVGEAKAEAEAEANKDPIKIQSEFVAPEVEDTTVQGPTVTTTTEQTVDYTANTSEVDKAVSQISSKKPKVETKFTESGYSSVKSKYDYIKDKSVSVSTLFLSSGYAGVGTQYDHIKNKTVTVTVDYKETGSKPTANASGTSSFRGGMALVNDGAPVGGSSAEMIVQNGRAFIAGNGQETILPLQKGAKIYTAAQTQAILNNSVGLNYEDLLTGSVPAYNAGVGTGFSVPTIEAGGGTPSTSGTTSSSSSRSSSSSSSDDAWKEEFENWLKERKHYLAMDLITEQEYYDSLEDMYKKYFSDLSKYQDEYWRYEEEVYNYRKKAIQDTIDLEEKLNNLAKAKTQKVLVYKDGRFQYVRNIEAIAQAQREVNAAYANGTTNAMGGLDLVGENGPELRVLNQGDGVIPADITKNLIRMGTMGIGALKGFGSTSTDIFNIGEVKLENVTDVESFFTGLKNLAMQSTTSRI